MGAQPQVPCTPTALGLSEPGSDGGTRPLRGLSGCQHPGPALGRCVIPTGGSSGPHIPLGPREWLRYLLRAPGSSSSSAGEPSCFALLSPSSRLWASLLLGTPRAAEAEWVAHVLVTWSVALFLRMTSKTGHIHFVWQPFRHCLLPGPTTDGRPVWVLRGAGAKGRTARGPWPRPHHHLGLGGRWTGPAVPGRVEGGQDAKVRSCLAGPGPVCAPGLLPRRLSLFAGTPCAHRVLSTPPGSSHPGTDPCSASLPPADPKITLWGLNRWPGCERHVLSF